MKAQKELHHNFSSVLKKKLIEKMLSHGHRVLKFVRLTMLKKITFLPRKVSPAYPSVLSDRATDVGSRILKRAVHQEQ